MYARAFTLYPWPTSILKSCVVPVNAGAFLSSLAMTALTAVASVGAALAMAGVVFSMGIGLSLP